jgi:hypothetical protein
MGIFRYTFRYGEPHTSPGYSPVPSEYFLVWDISIGLMLALLLTKTTRLSLKGVLFYMLLAGVCINTFFNASNFYVTGYVKSMLLYGFIGLLLYSDNSWLKISSFNRAIEWMTVFVAIFLCWQIFHYLFNGILPSHSHENVLIRFGSIWDDSLVFGALLPMFAGYYFAKYRKDSKISIAIAFLLNLVALMTGSFTAIAVSLAYSFYKLLRHPAMLALFICVATAGLLVFFGELDRFIEFKSESIVGHLKGLELLGDLKPGTIVGLAPVDRFVESGMLMLLINFGLPVMLLVVFLHLYTLASCKSFFLESVEVGCFAGATEGLIFSVLLFSLNLPIVILSPVYLFVAIFSGLILQRSLATRLHGNDVVSLGPIGFVLTGPSTLNMTE